MQPDDSGPDTTGRPELGRLLTDAGWTPRDGLAGMVYPHWVSPDGLTAVAPIRAADMHAAVEVLRAVGILPATAPRSWVAPFESVVRDLKWTEKPGANLVEAVSDDA